MKHSGEPARMSARRIGFCLAIVLLGALSLASTAAAQRNTAFGTGALASPASPDLDDSAFGFRTLNSATSGTNNTAIGAAALFSNTTGYNETACGAFALQHNTTGAGNTAIGTTALLNNTAGFDNTAIGNKACSVIPLAATIPPVDLTPLGATPRGSKMPLMDMGPWQPILRPISTPRSVFYPCPKTQLATATRPVATGRWKPTARGV